MLYISEPMAYYEGYTTIYSHLISTTSDSELHTFAVKAGLTRLHFIEGPQSFYMVPVSLFPVCIEQGAIGGMVLMELISKCIKNYHKQCEKENKDYSTWAWRK